jgi:hypothetical protein
MNYHRKLMLTPLPVVFGSTERPCLPGVKLPTNWLGNQVSPRLDGWLEIIAAHFAPHAALGLLRRGFCSKFLLLLFATEFGLRLIQFSLLLESQAWP